jgi:feruloyl esterase
MFLLNNLIKQTRKEGLKMSTQQRTIKSILIIGFVLSITLGFASPVLTKDLGNFGKMSPANILACLQKDFEFLLELSIKKVEAAGGLPEYMQVTGTLYPQIRFELRLPTKGWNKKFYMTGCGGFCGGVDTTFPNSQFTNNLNWGLIRGYAAATTDSGHNHGGAGRTYGAWALNNRRGEIDWGYRSIHDVTRVCKAIVKLFYHRPPEYSYFAGCSTGGRQAIMETLRYPEDFDGIISGAPALDYTGLVATWMSWIVQATQGITFDLNAIKQAVLNQCDDADGVLDGIISDPRRCRIDFSNIVPPDQLAALEKLYGKPVNSLGKELYPGGIPYGSEQYWNFWVPGAGLGIIRAFNQNFLKFMAFENDPPADWDPLSFNFDKHPQLLDFMGNIYNATSPDLKKFKKLGGKLIMYQGWADSIVPPAYTRNYYERVIAAMGGLEKTQDFFRFFLIPGMDHCSTQVKDGYDDFDMLSALENWVEKGEAPDVIIASGVTSTGTKRSRPLFPYPLFANYVGGDPNNPGSFVAANDGSVRWKQFRKDTFYAFEIVGFGNNPVTEGEELYHFYPYELGLEMGLYNWRVWSPSMFDDMDYPGFHGTFEVE